MEHRSSGKQYDPDSQSEVSKGKSLHVQVNNYFFMRTEGTYI